MDEDHPLGDDRMDLSSLDRLWFSGLKPVTLTGLIDMEVFMSITSTGRVETLPPISWFSLKCLLRCDLD